MNSQTTNGIILSRTNFGEADRILTVLTPDQGKLRLIAKGVRKAGAKLAGGIELFSVSSITFVQGRGEVSTLISARLIKHYGKIVKDINRVQLGYELLKQLNRATEDKLEPEYFELINTAFVSLDEAAVGAELIQVWFSAQLLRLAGHMPNLRADTSGKRLDADARYEFSYDDRAFYTHEGGSFSSSQIKFLRLLFSPNPPNVLQQVRGIEGLLPVCGQIVQVLAKEFIRI